MNSETMNCAEVEREQLIERYLANGLDEGLRLQLEEHYFNCDRCFAELESMRVVRAAVQEAGRPAAAEHRRAAWKWRAVWGMAALAAAAALVFVVSQPRRPSGVKVARKPGIQPVAEPEIAMLAQVVPPPYAAPVLRGSEGEAARAFHAAMQSYAKGDFRAAAAALGNVVEHYPDSTDARYFLGICDLLNGDTGKAEGELGRIARMGDATPYREEAEYYLALAYVKQNRRAEALSELERVIGMHRDYEQKAKALQAEIGR